MQVASVVLRWSLDFDLVTSLKLSQTCTALLSQEYLAPPTPSSPRKFYAAEWICAMTVQFGRKPITQLLELGRTQRGQLITAIYRDDPTALAACLEGDRQPKHRRWPFAYRDRCLEWCLQQGIIPFWQARSFEDVLQLVENEVPLDFLFDDYKPQFDLTTEQVFALLNASWCPSVIGARKRAPKTAEEASELLSPQAISSRFERDTMLWMEHKFQFFSNPETYDPESGVRPRKEYHLRWLISRILASHRLLEPTVALLVRTRGQAEELVSLVKRDYYGRGSEKLYFRFRGYAEKYAKRQAFYDRCLAALQARARELQ